MHILIVSACEKRAIKKTRAVLDSYATKISDTSWITPITVEGLRELRTAMKRGATRQTAVACYRNDGRSSMKLLWIVGSKDKFGPNGHFPSGTESRPRSRTPEWMKTVYLAATTAGLAHDIGKASTYFQNKLKCSEQKEREKLDYSKYVSDYVRHEIVSVNIMRKLRTGKSWNESWQGKAGFTNGLKCASEITRPHDVIDMAVATHHGMFPDSLENSKKITGLKLPDPKEEMLAAGDFSESIGKWQSTEDRFVESAIGLSRLALRGVFIIARAALIFSDHITSARTYTKSIEGEDLFAKSADPKGHKQPLWWHLQEVGSLAGKTVYDLLTMRLPTLSEEAVEHIIKPSGEGRFHWQDKGVSAIEQIRESSEAPMLILNLSGTGSGKTRANAKFACAAARHGDVRFATALNLRSLTLQTGAAYREQLNIGDDECSVVIGDSVVKKLFEADRNEILLQQKSTNEDDNPLEPEYFSTEIDFTPPLWLEEWIKKHPEVKSISGSPVLVSTIDYLIAAGDPGKQGHHVSALIRAISSDLILDEIDSYDPEAMVAVLRLINISAFFGRNVICASATLSYPVATFIHKAYQEGIKMRSELKGEPNLFHAVLTSDAVDPARIEDDFDADYRKYVESMFAIARPAYRKAILGRISERASVKDWCNLIHRSVLDMHNCNAWNLTGTDKKISFGLVRVANIKTAVAVANHLAKSMPHAMIACYHANEFMIQRHMKERRLDFLLSRGKGGAHIENDSEIIQIMRNSNSDSIPFILIATPVEEIGRDHDFDWAVIEPSSIQSIVQTCGRVNRHRLRLVEFPNIVILQFNKLHLENVKRNRAQCFIKPGLESNSDPHKSHDINELLPDMNEGLAISAQLRFDGCLFSQEDDKALNITASSAINDYFNSTYYLKDAFYAKYKLRSNIETETCKLENGEFYRSTLNANRERGWKDKSVDKTGSILPNRWLSWDEDTLNTYCNQYGIDIERGMSVNIPKYDKDDDSLTFNCNFGFYRGIIESDC